MDVKNVSPFMAAFNIVMPRLGFREIRKGDLQTKDKTFSGSGVIIIVGMVGELRGNVAYVFDTESAKKIAAAMLKVTNIDKLTEMSKSALGELTNMLTAHAATAFAAMKILMKISTPTCIEGDDIEITMSSEKVFCLQMMIDDSTIDVNISFEN
ncbi:MAG: chemotaxis protein CheX [Defluviitaleaceae bacterium]|nr:chemotaxis protein CheX [Defluviitaleaceae bacterium]